MYKQGIDGSARKHALVQDTEYMVEKKYHISPYLGAFGAYLMPHWPIYIQNVFSYTKMIVGTLQSNHIIFHQVKKPFVWSKTTPTNYIVEKTYHLAQYLDPFGAYLMPQGPI